MRKFLQFLFLVLTTVTCTAQQFNVNQIRPSPTNGQVVTTVGGVSQWAGLNVSPSFRMNYTAPAGGQYVFLTPTSCGVAATGSNGAGSGSCSPDGGAASISGQNIGPLNNVNMAATWGFTLPSYINQSNISAVYLAYGIGFTYAGIAEDITGATCTDGIASGATFGSGGGVLMWGTNTTAFGPTIAAHVNSITCTVGVSGSGYITPGHGGYLTLGASVGLFVYYSGTAPPTPPSLVAVVPPLAYQSGLLYFPLPFDVGNDTASTNSYNVTIPALNNVLGGQQLTPGVGVTLVAANASTSTTPTLNVNGTGGLTIQKNGNALASGDIAAGEPARLYFDGTYWQLENPVHPASGVTSVTNSDGSITFSPTTGAVVGSVATAHAFSWSATHTFTASLGFDASGAGQIKLPVTAGYASAANGEIGYDSTNSNWHLWNGADKILAPLATSFTSGHCGQLTASGGKWEIVDTGAACTTVSNSDGTLTISPTAGAAVASIALGHANTWTAKQSQPAPKFTDVTGSTECLHVDTSGQVSGTGTDCGSGSGSSTVNINGGSAIGSLNMNGLIPTVCSDTSGSGTAQSCTTSPSFTPQAGNCLAYNTTTANSGAGLTLNVNSLGAKSVAKWLGTTALVAGDIPANKTVNMCYDGTLWEAMTIGNAPTSGDTVTSPNSTINVGGTSTNTTLDVAPVGTVVDTGTPVTVSTAKPSEFHFNENATAATAVTYNLPTAAAGKQFCFANAYNGSAANTGTLELLTSAAGQFIIFTDGTLSATGGYVISGGAAADAACVVGVDSTHWYFYTQAGVWTKH